MPGSDNPYSQYQTGNDKRKPESYRSPASQGSPFFPSLESGY